MIKNLVVPAALAAVLAAAGCSAKTAVPPGYQGVVEYEDRVLSFELGGRLSKVAVRRGDAVTDGAVIAEIDDTLERLARAARVDEAEAASADLALLEAGAKREDIATLAAQVKGAQATLALVKKSADRAHALEATGAVARAEVDRADAEVERAAAEVKALEQRLASLQRGARSQEIARAKARVEALTGAVALSDEKIARHALRAKGAGEVLDVHLDPGELAAAGAPVVTMADTTHPYVEVFVPVGELEGVRTGAKASVRLDSGKAPLAGSVEHVSQKTEFTPRYIFSERERPNLVVRVRVRIDDPGKSSHAGVPAFVTIER